MSTTNPQTVDKSKNRLPAPSLFVGPPSRNVSTTSLHLDPSGTNAARVPLTRQRSPLSGITRLDAQPSNLLSSNDGAISNLQSPFSRRPILAQHQTEQQSTERDWAEMQNTLEEVELSTTSGTHVFGPGHSKALEELRTAQIALAQAWAKSETEPAESADGGQGSSGGDKKTTKATENQPLQAVDTLIADRNEKLGAAGRARSGTDGSAKSQFEEDTENDIAMARKRREENDQYFQRVNTGVVDVVQKLEQVAKAMKVVEMESKEIWGDRDSMDSASIA